MDSTPYSGLIAFFSFALSVIAAVLAIDMYALLRTGEFGRTWRVLITASVVLALSQALRLANWFDWETVQQLYLADITQMAFVIMLGYAFYTQRTLFSSREPKKPNSLSIEDRIPARRASDFLVEEPNSTETNASEASAEQSSDNAEDGDDIEWESSSGPTRPGH